MKVKFMSAAFMAATLLAGFTSCSNENEEAPDNGTTKNMLIKIASETPVSRAEGPSQAAAQVAFTSGELFFTNGTAILAKYTITSTPTSATNIDLADLTSANGATITNLPGNVTHVHVVGNTSAIPATTSIAAIKNHLLNVESQKTTSAGNVVNLFGEAAATLTTANPAGTNDLYSAAITLAPTVARIELTDITAKGTAIKGFEVEGIFVDNYYAQAGVGGAVSGTVVDNAAAATTATLAAAAFHSNNVPYPTASDGATHDWYGTSPIAAASNVAKPGTGVWGYNVFAAAGGSAVPRLVIRLKNITGTGVNFPDPQFITIKGFKNPGGTAITSIEPGKVYTIGAGVLKFDESNVSPIPNAALIDVEVTVTVASWVPKAVEPEL